MLIVFLITAIAISSVEIVPLLKKGSQKEAWILILFTLFTVALGILYFINPDRYTITDFLFS